MAAIQNFTLPIPEMTFAGFTFPKWLWDLPKGSLKSRLDKFKRREPKYTGPYYHSPTPKPEGNCFYLDSDGMPGLRWQWADEIAKSIRHTGWFTDDYGDGDTIRGIVFRLPRGRGFLAGWSMGEGMASSVEYYTYENEIDAALAADGLAEYAAEREREYNRQWDEEHNEIEECEEVE